MVSWFCCVATFVCEFMLFSVHCFFFNHYLRFGCGSGVDCRWGGSSCCCVGLRYVDLPFVKAFVFWPSRVQLLTLCVFKCKINACVSSLCKNNATVMDSLKLRFALGTMALALSTVSETLPKTIHGAQRTTTTTMRLKGPLAPFKDIKHEFTVEVCNNKVIKVKVKSKWIHKDLSEHGF